MKEYKIGKDTYRIKPSIYFRLKKRIKNPNKIIHTSNTFTIQKKWLIFWFNSTESEEGYYFSLKDAENSIKQIERWSEDKKMIRVRKDGTMYFTTSDFFKRKGVKEVLESLRK